MNNNVPNVPVHDLLVHARENDLVVGTYGRGLFVTDITPLQEMNAGVLAEDVHVFGIEPKTQRIIRSFGAEDYLFGDRHLLTPNEPNGIVIDYYLKSGLKEKVKIRVTDPYGAEMAALDGPAEAGLNRAVWDMRRRLTRAEQETARQRGSRDPLALWAAPGEYVVTLDIAGKTFTQKARITKTAGWSIGPFPIIIR